MWAAMFHLAQPLVFWCFRHGKMIQTHMDFDANHIRHQIHVIGSQKTSKTMAKSVQKRAQKNCTAAQPKGAAHGCTIF